MPEGPSIVILREESMSFKGQKIIEVGGKSKLHLHRLLNKKIINFKSWGKHFLICFDEFTLRIHFMLFGSYRINEGKETVPRLHLRFKKGELNFYACSIKFLEGDPDQYYDWSSDVMNKSWDPVKARKKMREAGDALICDLLLQQDIFSGVGNIIKNEILYLSRIHPESIMKKIPSAKITKLIKEARDYSFRFLEWKKKYELKKHWLAHTKKLCLRCKLPIIKKYTGHYKRRSFFCARCQLKYT